MESIIITIIKKEFMHQGTNRHSTTMQRSHMCQKTNQSFDLSLNKGSRMITPPSIVREPQRYNSENKSSKSIDTFRKPQVLAHTSHTGKRSMVIEEIVSWLEN